jgi:thiol-disulfide isomerase/thioredoxin
MKWMLAVLVAGAVAAWPGACARNRAPQQAESATPEHVKLDYTLKDMSGKDVRLADYVGKPLIINFWATWCGPCKEEIPSLVALSEQYKEQGLTVLGVSIDDSPDDLKKFAAEYKMTYPILVGQGHDDMLEEFEATYAVPVSWFIKADGKVSIKHEGAASRDWFDQQIKALF